MLSYTTVPPAHVGLQVLALRDFNERIYRATRLMTKQGSTVEVGDTAVSGDTMDPRLAFTLEEPV